MEDTEMSEQQLPNASQVNHVDTAVQQQQPSNPTEDQTANETIADETLTMPTDVDMTDNPPLPDNPDNKSSADAPPPAEPLEKESNGDAAPLPSTPKSEPERVEKSKSWLLDPEMGEADEAGTLEERAAFMKELESFYKDKSLEFKPPKFYGEPLNCLKLWRAVIKLGGYEVVTASKLWRQVGESFNPPKTCTTVSWTFRIFYEKALLEYEKYKKENGEIQLPASSLPHASGEKESSGFLPGSGGRARRDAAARAMQGWHAQRSVGYGEATEPIIKDKISSSTPKRERQLKNIGLPKQKTPINMESGHEPDKQLITEIVDAGTPADWVKINVRETKDCFEVYALVPGLLREEVRVQSDPAGRLVITGHPEQVDNPWGITPFKKVVTLPARIDPLQTSAVVSLHGRLFVRVPFEQGSV
ncbi:AT RICH INTERACTION DOMAIN 4 [Hibiscus trionum]|uniref:AT RICH INTERACTION DOMAIN 4 n=1 Tax=Hibiscus trionum TaxID=183268 RepID=A0A9W7IXB4_HIBTR|nr:AT RICH INTERACTION DOMAIN 4 [Hibiscus trionum]